MRAFFLALVALSSLWADDRGWVRTPSGHVNDRAHLLTYEYADHLEKHLRAISHDGGPEIAVMTVQSLGAESVETAARKIFDEWGIGKRGKDNGVLLLIALKERRVRIETGYGLEGKLNDAYCGRIIRDQLTPDLKVGKYEAGISKAVDAISKRIYDGKVEPMSKTSDNWDSIIFILGVFSIFSILEIYFWIFKKRSFIAMVNRTSRSWGGGSGGGGFGGFGGGRGGGGGASGRF